MTKASPVCSSPGELATALTATRCASTCASRLERRRRTSARSTCRTPSASSVSPPQSPKRSSTSSVPPRETPDQLSPRHGRKAPLHAATSANAGGDGTTTGAVAVQAVATDAAGKERTPRKGLPREAAPFVLLHENQPARWACFRSLRLARTKARKTATYSNQPSSPSMTA